MDMPESKAADVDPSPGDTGLHEREATERELQRANDELRLRNQFLQAVFDSLSTGVVVADADARLAFANPAAERMVGTELTDAGSGEWQAIYGTFFPDRVTPVPAEALPLVRAIHGESTNDVHLFIRNPRVPDGLYIRVSGRPMRDSSGAIIGAVIVFGDSTPEVLEREALTQAFAQGRLEVIDTVLHNIGNAINSVSVGISTIKQKVDNAELLRRFVALADTVAAHEDDWIEWLSNDPQGRKVRGFFLSLVQDLTSQHESLKQTAVRVGKRVRNIVDIIRTQKSSTKSSVERQVVHLRSAIAEAIKVLDQSLAQRGIAVSVDCDAGPDEILVQESRFNQMLVNLLKNAMEAIDDLARRDRGHPAAEPAIRVAAHVEGQFLVLEVTDNGIGMEPDRTDEVFRAGYTTKAAGTGLGLHSAANYVIGSGGFIVARSQGIGHGATIRVDLRLGPIDEGV